MFLIFFSQLNAADIRALFFNGNCATCHYKNTVQSAPSITEIRNVYRSVFLDKSSFVKHMSEWVLKPDANTSLMSGAIKKFELMPELGYDLDTLKEISKYIYETDFSKKHDENTK